VEQGFEEGCGCGGVRRGGHHVFQLGFEILMASLRRDYSEPWRCTLLFLLQRRNVLPFHQKRIPKRHHRRMSEALVMMGSMNLCPVSINYLEGESKHTQTQWTTV